MLVECGILLLGDVVWVSHPDWLLLVHQLPLVGDFLHLLLLLLLLLILLIDLLDLRGITLLVIGPLVLLIVVADLLLGGLLNPQADWVVDELRVLLDELLRALLVEVLLLVILQVHDDLGTTAEVGVGILHDGERTTCG